MLGTKITDSKTGLSARVADGDDPHALVVATRPLKTFKSETLLFSNETYGVNMNINAGSGGTPVNIHNGLDNIYWTASNIVGLKAIFNSTDQAYDGTRSIFYNNQNEGDVVQYLNSSTISPSNYVSLTMWIYVLSDWGNDSISIYGWNTTTNSQIGDAVLIENYFNQSNNGFWQKVTIPLVDFNFSGDIDAFRTSSVLKDGAKSPIFYLDLIQLQETGAPVSFEIHPEEGTWLYVTSISQIFVDALNTTLASNSMVNLSYDKILGVILSSGYNFQVVRERNKISFSLNVRNIFDLMQLPNTEIHDIVSDGTNTMLKIKNDISNQQILLKSENNDFIRFVISEDLTGFLQFRSALAGYSEERRDYEKYC